jgi:hypothetical protein
MVEVREERGLGGTMTDGNGESKRMKAVGF